MRASRLIAALLVACGCAEPTGSAEGVVTFGQEGASGVDVTLLGPVTRSTRTGATGGWSASLPPGQYAVTASAPDTREQAVSTTLEVVAGRRATVEPLQLTPVGRITGTVTLRGDPAQVQALVVGGGGAASARSDGTFVIEAVPAGKRDVVLWAPGFVQLRVAGVEVRRGEATEVGARALQEITTGGTAPAVGVLRGSVRVPGGDDSGVMVTIDGLPQTAATAADGTFVLRDVPAGIVALQLRKGDAWARLPRVLVAPGSEGFIIDGGLFELPRAPVPLGRGARLDDQKWYVGAISPDAQWVALATAGELALLGPDGGLSVISKAPQVGVGSTRQVNFQTSDAGLAYWHAEQDSNLSRIVLVRTSLPSMTNTILAAVPYLNGTVFLPLGDGAAWTFQSSLYVRPNATTRPTQVLSNLVTNTTALPLPDGTVLAMEPGQLDHFSLDGTLLDSTAIPATSQAMSGSSDGRYVLLSPATGVGPTLLDRWSRTTQVLGECLGLGTISPDGQLIDCSTTVREVQSGAVTQVGSHSYLRWLPGGRASFIVATGAPGSPELHVLGVGQPHLIVTGLSWYAILGFPNAAATHLRVFADLDVTTGLGRALDVRLADGQRTVLAEGVSPQLFVGLENGALVGKPRTIGTDLDLVYVPAATSETEALLGRWSIGLYRPTVDRTGTRVSAARFLPGRGYETITFDTASRQLVPQISAGLQGTWVDEHRLFTPRSEAEPFSSATGLYVTEVP